MKYLFHTVFIAVALVAPTLSLAEPVSIFGLPLGGKYLKTINLCPKNGKKSDQICWIDKPSLHKTFKGGYVIFPESSVPVWTFGGIGRIYFGLDGTIQEITADVSENADPQKIIDSIGIRFGKPNMTDLTRTQYKQAKWLTNDISIWYLCAGRSTCRVEFTTLASIKEGEEVAKKNISSRPLAP